MTLVHSDARGRLSLGKLLDPERDYRLTQGSHGAIILEPVSVITDYERSVLAEPGLVSTLERGNTEIESGRTVPRRRGDR